MNKIKQQLKKQNRSLVRHDKAFKKVLPITKRVVWKEQYKNYVCLDKETPKFKIKETLKG